MHDAREVCTVHCVHCTVHRDTAPALFNSEVNNAAAEFMKKHARRYAGTLTELGVLTRD